MFRMFKFFWMFGCLDLKRPGRMFRMLFFPADVYFSVIYFKVYMFTLRTVSCALRDPLLKVFSRCQRTHNLHTTSHSATAWHLITLHNITSHHIWLHHIPPNCITLHRTRPVPHRIASHSATSQNIAPHHTILDRITSHRAAFHRITLYSICIFKS